MGYGGMGVRVVYGQSGRVERKVLDYFRKIFVVGPGVEVNNRES